MSYLSNEEIMTLKDSVSLYSIDNIDDILHYSFDSGVDEYNQFLFEKATEFHSLHISNTFLLIHNDTDGMSIKTLQYVMGHSDISTTLNIYTHWDGDKAIAEMQKAVDKPSKKAR